MQHSNETRIKNKIYCANCKMELGETITIKSVEFVLSNNMLLRELKGVCWNCGKAFHFTVMDKQLEKIFETIKKEGSNML